MLIPVRAIAVSSSPIIDAGTVTTGASSTAAMSIVAVATSESFVPSAAVNVKLTSPLKSAAGSKASEASSAAGITWLASTATPLSLSVPPDGSVTTVIDVNWEALPSHRQVANAPSDESGNTSRAIGLRLIGIPADTEIGVHQGGGSRTGYLLPFEIVSIHLLVVLVGAAYLARAKRREPTDAAGGDA